MTLAGILWGGYSDGSLFVYSPLANVQRTASPGPALGLLTTCVSSAGC